MSPPFLEQQMFVRVQVTVNKAQLRDRLCGYLNEPGVLVSVIASRGGVWRPRMHEVADVVIVAETVLPKPAANAVASVRSLRNRPEIIVFAAGPQGEGGGQLLSAGASAVLHEGMPPDQIRGILRATIQKRADLRERAPGASIRPAGPSLNDFLSDSPAMEALLATSMRVAGASSSLLIVGETGVGKEHLARAIHAAGGRASGPFVAISCAALPDTLLESELFGHEEGAFTGASRQRRGYFELAHHGTIFLDEIGDMPLHLQTKLLRVLQDKTIQRVGGETTIEVDARVVAATHRDLIRAVQAGRFREDLFYRLGVVSLEIPPLRDRRQDIPRMVMRAVNESAARLGRQIVNITTDAMDALVQYDWPGNVRELMNAMERAVLLCETGDIDRAELPANIAARPGLLFNSFAELAASSSAGLPGDWLQLPLHEVRRRTIEAMERAYLAGLLTETRGQVGLTARRAGIRPRSLYDKMRHYGLRKEDYRHARKRQTDPPPAAPAEAAGPASQV